VDAGLLTNRPAAADAPPDSLSTLAARFEPRDIDVPVGSARIRLSVRDRGDWDAIVAPPLIELEPAGEQRPDAVLEADEGTWAGIAADVRGGMDAFRRRRLRIRQNLHLGVGFLAATSGSDEPGRLRFERIRTAHHELSILSAGQGDPVVCIHGLGGTKASFLSTVSALAPNGYRVIAVDLPGFGDSHKPFAGAYDSPYFAAAITELLDALGIDRAHLVGNSMGGRVAIEAGLLTPERVRQIVLLSPALAWLRPRQWDWLLRLDLPKLGFIQPAPRWAVEPIVRSLVPGAQSGWAAAGVDEFLRAFLTPHGRVAFYEAARNIYMDEPHGVNGFWTRLRELSPATMFVWGRHDGLVPISFMKHVESALPAARHVELDCGHVPQMEAPEATHRAMAEFFAEAGSDT
jgi:pimeloyl-ACP methyl ester carboxylesterase